MTGWPADSPLRQARFPFWGMSVTTDRLLDIAGLAERLGVGERFVRRLVNERAIPFVKVGRHVRFDAGDVEAWIRDSKVDAAQPFTGASLVPSRA